MSYHEENGQVVLAMSRDDYDALLIWLGIAAGYLVQRDEDAFRRTCALLDRINEGNPHYIPYEVEPEKP